MSSFKSLKNFFDVFRGGQRRFRRYSTEQNLMKLVAVERELTRCGGDSGVENGTHHSHSCSCAKCLADRETVDRDNSHKR